MMFARTQSERDTFSKFYNDLHEMTAEMEKAHDAEPVTSTMLEPYLQYGHHFAIGNAVQTVAPTLFEMKLVIFIAGEGEAFITPDEPCTWHNPQSYKFPPMLRSPGLAQQDIEVCLPISPRYLALPCRRGDRTGPAKNRRQLRKNSAPRGRFHVL